MTHEKILKLIDKAGFDVELPSVQDGTSLSYKLAKLAIESEREACAKIAESWLGQYPAKEITDAIRARGQA